MIAHLPMNRSVLRSSSAALALAVFLVDVLTPLEGAVAVLYVVAILLAARTSRRNDILIAAASCVILTITAYVLSHDLKAIASPALRALVSLAAIVITAVLAVENQAATARLAAQARLLNLSHDMIFVRDRQGVVTFWNTAAEQVYGWKAEEAVGVGADQLLRTVYPESREAVEADLIDRGRWEGRLEQRTKAGLAIVVDARWALQHDHLGKPIGVLETHTDVTDREAAHAALVRSEQRYRRMFDESRIGVAEEDWTDVRAALRELDTGGLPFGDYLSREPDFVRHARSLARITDVNLALCKMVGVETSAKFVDSVDKFLGESDKTFLGALVAFAEGAPFFEGETELVASGRRRIPVLFTLTFPRDESGDRNVLAFVVDISERKQAQDDLLAAQAELAHAARVATLGELTASIAHEVNQPLAAIVTSGEAGMRWLRRDVPNVDEVASAIGRIISEGRRAGEIVRRIRAFVGKTPAQQDTLDVAEVIEEAVLLVDRELSKEDIKLTIQPHPRLPAIRGDRVQLQQVLINLMVNAAQAMSGQSIPRNLTIRTGVDGSGSIMVAVEDTGPGVAPGDLSRLFQPFFTTKLEGMGMGLAICRTTVEAHGGQLSVESMPGSGTVFSLTLPVIQEQSTP